LSIEAEYKTLTNATVEIIWVQTLLSELNTAKHITTFLWCDNLGAIYLSTNSVFHARTKYIKIDYHFMREQVARKQLDIQFISINDQLADEALSTTKLKNFQYNMNLGKL
jgi:EAL domain-containing protein (putative c-di-GMP-specific phosphodiesterase class I)